MNSSPILGLAFQSNGHQQVIWQGINIHWGEIKRSLASIKVKLEEIILTRLYCFPVEKESFPEFYLAKKNGN